MFRVRLRLRVRVRLRVGDSDGEVTCVGCVSTPCPPTSRIDSILDPDEEEVKVMSQTYGRLGYGRLFKQF